MFYCCEEQFEDGEEFVDATEDGEEFVDAIEGEEEFVEMAAVLCDAAVAEKLEVARSAPNDSIDLDFRNEF